MKIKLVSEDGRFSHAYDADSGAEIEYATYADVSMRPGKVTADLGIVPVRLELTAEVKMLEVPSQVLDDFWAWYRTSGYFKEPSS